MAAHMQLPIQELTILFDDIYESNKWAYMSGPGSLAVANKPLIQFLSDFIATNNISTICDFGCGDWQYMQHVDLKSAEYLGLDVSNKILEANARKFSGKRISFMKTPSDLSLLPDVDLFFSKDTFMHLPNQYVKTVIDTARKKCRFFLSVTNATEVPSANPDIKAGQFRDVNLRVAPFCANTIDLFKYGKTRIPDPAYPSILSSLMGRYAWPGRKTVQLIIGHRFSIGDRLDEANCVNATDVPSSTGC
jgi:hypothetical protein